MSTEEFNITAEMAYASAEGDTDTIVDSLIDYGIALGESVSKRQLVTITVPAPHLKGAITTGMALISEAAGDIVSLQAMSTQAFDETAGIILHPAPLLSVQEFAQKLGTSRQNVVQRIKRGSLPGVMIGNTWMLPATALPDAKPFGGKHETVEELTAQLQTRSAELASDSLKANTEEWHRRSHENVRTQSKLAFLKAEEFFKSEKAHKGQETPENFREALNHLGDLLNAVHELLLEVGDHPDPKD
ncbi:helix-turn-helix domain-containing protein [Nesterenkonia rhizosphaerae]|uniref:DNA-binding protein n=1 Tax=Nesterenkonia rhizosphaerae TaxID=1348272 RepID=A0ABP9G1U8_9MICC